MTVVGASGRPLHLAGEIDSEYKDENPKRSPIVKDFLRENWIYIVAPVVIILIVIVVLIFTGGTDSPFTYNIF